MEAKKSLVCKCGKQAKFIQMLTFSYNYCELCRIEVTEEKPKKKFNGFDLTDVYDTYAYTSPAMIYSGLSSKAGPGMGYGYQQVSGAGTPSLAPNTGALPPGYVALKGDMVTCDICGHLKFFLPCDLVEMQSTPWAPSLGRGWSKEILDEVNKWEPSGIKDDCRCSACVVGEFADRVDGGLHIKGRGWV